jgi:hypothetical protein
MPMDDWEEHEPSTNCWCGPKPDPKNLQEIKRGLADRHVWVHKRIKNSKQEMN